MVYLQNIKPDKYLGDLDCFHTPDLLVGNEEVNHPSHDHINERVDPHRCQKDQNSRHGWIDLALLLPRAHGAYDESGKFPQSPHDDHPTKLPFFVVGGLEDV